MQVAQHNDVSEADLQTASQMHSRTFMDDPKNPTKIFERINHFMDRILCGYTCTNDYGIATSLIVTSLFVIHFRVQCTGQQIHSLALKPDLLRYHLKHWTDIFTHGLFHVNFVYLLLNAMPIITFGAPVEASIETLR